MVLPQDDPTYRLLTEANAPAHITAVLAADPSVTSSAATMAQSTAGLVPAWKASTAYVVGQRVVAPDGDIVSAKVGFTSAATYSATNWTTSNHTVTIDNAIGRRAFAWDIGNNRTQMIYGDTGLRDIAALVPDRTAGAVSIHRNGNVVTLYLDALTTSGTGTYTHAGMIPFGFRPAATSIGTTMSLVPGIDQFRVGISTAGNFSFYSYVTGKLMRLTLTYSTNQAWPASLPGTAVGATV